MRAIKSAVLAAVGSALMLLPAGCSTSSESANPVDWWHSLEGGRIAEQRPPPPNADAPYPNLSTVPPRPKATDTVALGRIASGLTAERANAAYAGASMTDLYAPRTPPQGAGRVAAPPASDAPSASLLAANASPSAATRRGAADGGIESRPLAPLSAPAPAGQAARPGAGTPDTGTAEAVAASMPAAPPPAPRIAGIDVPATTVPTLAPVAPPAPPPLPKATTTATSVLVPFQPGAAEITPEAQDALRNLVLRRGAAAMEALGYGDAPRGDPAGQSAALPLALARSRAIAAVLMASGVPASLVHLQAEAEGRGGAARISGAGAAAANTDPGAAAHGTN